MCGKAVKTGTASVADPEISRLEEEARAVLGQGPYTEMIIGIARGMLDLERSDFLTALREFYGPGSDVRKEELGPLFQASYQERAARFIESAPDARLLPMLLDGLEIPLSEADDEIRELLVGKKSRVDLAATLRSSPIKGVPPDFSVGNVEGTLSDSEIARLHRTLRVLMPLIFDACEKAELQGNIGPVSEATVVLGLVAPVLMLRDPPKAEKYGRKNRSRLLLPSDRKPCQYVGCLARIGNREKYCPEHRRLVIADRDYEKKKERPTRRLSADHRTAANQMVPKEERRGMSETLPEEFAPQLEALKRRRRPDLH
jgi:hypothetical protein